MLNQSYLLGYTCLIVLALAQCLMGFEHRPIEKAA